MRIKSIISSSIGNILEWYDFGLFAIYSTIFSQLFFPEANPRIALLETLGIFSIGFFCRPIGALIFGYLGDKRGRSKTLRLSILMISLPTLLIGLLPTYASIGVAAPILLLLIRIWQGISLGGEYSGNLIYLAESAPSKHRATITAFAGAGANLGILLASIVGGITSYCFSDTVFMAWGWRIPYIISGVFCLFIYATRLQMQETAAFEYIKSNQLIVANPIKTMLKLDMPFVLRTLGLVCMGSTFYFFCFIYIPLYLGNTLQLPLFKTTTLISISIGSMLILVPLAGMLCDRIGRRRMLLFNVTFVILVTIPGFLILHLGYTPLALVTLILFTIASSLEQGTTPVALVENYPLPARYTGLSLGYNLGNGIFGGTVPIVSEWLVYKTNFVLAPAFYITFCAMITAVVIFFFVKETRGVSLIKH